MNLGQLLEGQESVSAYNKGIQLMLSNKDNTEVWKLWNANVFWNGNGIFEMVMYFGLIQKYGNCSFYTCEIMNNIVEMRFWPHFFLILGDKRTGDLLTRKVETFAYHDYEVKTPLKLYLLDVQSLVSLTGSCQPQQCSLTNRNFNSLLLPGRNVSYWWVVSKIHWSSDYFVSRLADLLFWFQFKCSYYPSGIKFLSSIIMSSLYVIMM